MAITPERLHELEDANRQAHAAFIAAVRKQRDTTKPPRGAVAAYRRMVKVDRAYQAAAAALGIPTAAPGAEEAR